MRLCMDVLALLSVLVSPVMSMSPFTRSLLERVSRKHRRATDQTFLPCRTFGCVHGDCTVKNNVFNCVCHDGYKGQLCNEIDTVKDAAHGKTDRCFGNFHCNNGGSCAFGPGLLGGMSVRCECPPQWTGEFCDIPCKMDCKNGGTCYSNRRTREEMCICLWGYSGRYCQLEKPLEPTLAVV